MGLNVNLAVDWCAVITVARSCGLRKTERELGMSKGNLNHIDGGKNPSFENGIKLLVWWSRQTGKPISHAPTLNKKPATLQTFSFLDPEINQ